MDEPEKGQGSDSPLARIIDVQGTAANTQLAAIRKQLKETDQKISKMEWDLRFIRVVIAIGVVVLLFVAFFAIASPPR